MSSTPNELSPDKSRKEVAPTPEGVERMETRAVYTPRVDIHENDQAITLIADLPGVDRSDVDIMLEKNTLTLRAKAVAKAPEGYSLAHGEYETGDFERSFTVSEDVDPDAIAAEVRDGVLTVTLPKRAPRTRRINIGG